MWKLWTCRSAAKRHVQTAPLHSSAMCCPAGRGGGLCWRHVACKHPHKPHDGGSIWAAASTSAFASPVMRLPLAAERHPQRAGRPPLQSGRRHELSCNQSLEILAPFTQGRANHSVPANEPKCRSDPSARLRSRQIAAQALNKVVRTRAAAGQAEGAAARLRGHCRRSCLGGPLHPQLPDRAVGWRDVCGLLWVGG